MLLSQNYSTAIKIGKKIEKKNKKFKNKNRKNMEKKQSIDVTFLSGLNL